MFDWLIHIYRRTSRITRRVMTIILAGVIALSTMHVLTLPAVTLTEDTAGEDPGIVLDGENGTDPAEPSEDPVVIEVTPEPEPTPEETYIPEPTAEPSFEPAPEPTPEVTPVPAETPVTTEEPTTVPTEEPTPETTASPEPTVTPEMTPVPSETPEVTAEPTGTPEATPEPSEEPEETAEPTAEPVPDMTEEEEEELAENQLVSEEDLKDAEPAADPEADRESAEYWMSMFSGIELSGVWADDLITIAESQIGYHESTRNYVVANKRHYGYSRYGAWYGSPYGDWCAMFVSYCLNYAGIPREAVPYEAYCPRWIELLVEKEMYAAAGEYVPAKGDLIYFDWNIDGTADHIGLVKAVEYEEENPVRIITIEGNSSDAVHENTYAFDDNRIMGFGILPENPELIQEEEPEETPETDEEIPAETNEYLFLNGSTDTVEVSVMYETDALPEGVQLVVTPVEQDDVLEAINGAVTDKEVMHVEAVDITFLDQDGNPVEPTKPIKVTMMAKKLPVQTPAENPVVVHVDDDLNTDIVESNSLSSETATFDAEHFSVYAMVYTVETYYTTADGETYKITVAYDSMSGIPQDVELRVSEITAEHEDYNEYLAQAAEAAETDPAGEIYARFFDIEIWSGEEKIEPVNDVSVSITLDDKPENASAMKIVHFTTDGVRLIATDGQPQDNADVSFVTDSFSVYGVITAPAVIGVNDLDGRTFTMDNNGRYVTSAVVPGNPDRLGKSSSAGDAAVWQFESAGANGQYYIYTMADGEKKYINMDRNPENIQNAVTTLGTSPQAFTVTMENGEYVFSRVSGGQTYYLNEFSGESGTGYAGYYARNNRDDTFRLNFTQPTFDNNGQYMTLVKYNGKYYIVNNDATLTEVNYDEATKTVEVEDPMLWTYNGNHLYFHSKETGFQNNQIASDFYRRYLNPGDATALSDEDAGNVSLATDYTWYSPDAGKNVDCNHVSDRTNMENLTSINISGTDTHTISHGGYYLGLEFDDAGNPIKVVGQKSAAEAAEIVFAGATGVKDAAHLQNTVNHIDISISGEASVSIPLSYGTYYGPHGEAGDPVKIVAAPEKIELSKDQMVNQDQLRITADDIKRATITAARADDGTQLDDAFYITGYSGNVTTPYSGDQVRIEGSFLVSDLRGTEYETIDSRRYDGWWGQGQDYNYINAVRRARLANKVEYTVTVVKPVEYYLIDPVVGQLYDEDGNPIKVTVDVAFSASFNYWDDENAANGGNECPPLQGNNDWKAGDIPSHDMSGMDFVLGGNADNPNSPLVALEITKIIMDESGNRIEVKYPVTSYFDLYENKTADRNSVAGLNVGQYEGEREGIYNGYTPLHSKKVTVKNGGTALIFDYNVTSAMYYIVERSDEESLPEVITDQDGAEWTYVKTYIETEYVRRGDQYDDSTQYPDPMHVTKEYTRGERYASVPEVLGSFIRLDNEPKKEGFLEFYVYNIYTQGTSLDVEKQWLPENGEAPEGAEVTVELYYAKRLTGTGSGPLPAEDIAPWPAKEEYISAKNETLFDTSLSKELKLTANPEDETKNWKGEFEGLPKTLTDADGNVYEVDYYAKETKVTINGQDVTGKYRAETEKTEPTAEESSTSDGKVTIRNEKEEVKITVEKQWDPEPESGASVTVELHRYAKKSKGTLIVTLLDQNDAPIPGAEFIVEKLNDESGEYEPASSPMYTDVNGIVSVSGLEPGTYRLVENNAPEGYTTDDQRIQTGALTVQDNTTTPQTLSETLRNRALVTAGQVELTVTGAGNGTIGGPIEGAVFSLYKDGELYNSGYVSNSDGKIIVGNLPAGSYYFIQTGTPNEYDLNDNPQTAGFTVQEQPGEVQHFTQSMVNWFKAKGDVTVTLTRQADGSPISGAVFELWSNGVKVNQGTTDANGQLTFGSPEKLGAGTYVVRQTSTAEGFGLAAEQVFTIEDNADVNQHTDLSFTNDIASGNVTIRLYRKGGKSDQWNWSLMNTYNNLIPGKEYTFRSTFDTGLYSDNVWIYQDDSKEYNNGDYLDQSKVRSLDASGYNNGTYTFRFTPPEDGKVYTLVMVSGWGVDNIRSFEMIGDTRAMNALTKDTYTRSAKLQAVSRTTLTAAADSSPAITDAAPASAPEGYAEDSAFVPVSHTITGSPWSYEFPAQDKYDADGNLYYYYIVETAHTPEKYWIDSYTNDPLSESGTIIVRNIYQTGSLTITKNWEGEPLTDVEKNALSFTITGKNIGGEGVNTLTVTYDEFTDGVYTVSGLPLGESYTVSETNAGAISATYQLVADESTTSGTAAVADINGAAIGLVNKYEKKPAGLNVTKIFANAADTQKNSIEITVYKADGTTVVKTISGAELQAGGGTVTLTQADGIRPGETYVIKETGTADIDGVTRTTTATYTAQTGDVTEENITSNPEISVYVSTADGTDAAAGSATITNTYTRDVYARKVWKQGESEMTVWPKDQTVTFQLQQNNGTAEEPDWIPVTGKDDITVSSPAAVSWSELPADKQFRIVETRINGEVLETAIIADSGTGSQEDPYVVTNNETTEITVDKKWFQADGTTEITDTIENASITVHLSDGTHTVAEDADGNAFGEAGHITLNNPWTYTWSNLPKYDAEGNEITYSVIETAASVGENSVMPEGTESMEATAEDETKPAELTLINTLPKTTAEADKTWLNADGTTTPPEGAQAVFELYADGVTTYKTVTLNGKQDVMELDPDETIAAGQEININALTVKAYESAAWRAFWDDLPVYTDKGMPIIYTIRESSVLGVEGYTAESEEPAESGSEIRNVQQKLSLDIVKVDADGMTTPLEGARFTLTALDPAGTGNHMQPVKTYQSDLTGKDGRTSIANLPGGYYEVDETEVPVGYIISGENPFYIHVDAETKEIVLLGKDTSKTVTEWAGISSGKILTGEHSLTVGNEAGTALPHTGGTGSSAVYLTGLLLMMLSGLLYSRRKRPAMSGHGISESERSGEEGGGARL